MKIHNGFYLSGAGLPRLSWKKAIKWGVCLLKCNFIIFCVSLIAQTRRPASADRTACHQTSRQARYEAKCVQRRCFQCGPVPLRSDIKGTELPPANILIPLERQLIALQLCRWEFLYNETLRQTFRPVLSKLSKRRQIQVLYPHFKEVRGGIEAWLMARWKARVEFLLNVIELLFYLLRLRRYKAKCAKTWCL